MRAVVCPTWGGPEVLELHDMPSPAACEGHIRVAVEAAGVNFADILMVAGKYQENPPLPFTPGFEVAGTVAGWGEGVEGRTLGQEVLAVTRFGGYATKLVAPAHQVLPLPSGWSLEQAAGFSAVFLTAYHALFELAHPRPGKK